MFPFQEDNQKSKKTPFTIAYQDKTNSPRNLCPFNREKTKILIFHQCTFDIKTNYLKT